MSNGIIRHKATFNISSGVQDCELSVGETWAGKRPPLGKYLEQYRATLPLAAQIHPYLQGTASTHSMLALNEQMVSTPGFSVAYTDGDPSKVWAFGKIRKIGGGLGDAMLCQSAEYHFHQFGVTTRHDVVTQKGLEQHPEGEIHRKAASALLWCAVDELPEEARVHMIMADDDSRSDQFFRGHAGFTSFDVDIPELDGYLVSATVSTIRDNLMYHDSSFLMWRLPLEKP